MQTIRKSWREPVFVHGYKSRYSYCVTYLNAASLFLSQLYQYNIPVSDTLMYVQMCMKVYSGNHTIRKLQNVCKQIYDRKLR